jgi:hypothetical protein
VDIYKGQANTLSVEWRAYAGGPMTEVVDVQLAITLLTGGAPVLGPTSTGVSNPATGFNAYAWTPDTDLASGQYLATWTGTDPELDTVAASEILTVTDGVPVGASYATPAMLKRRMAIPDTNTYVTADLEDALRAASSGINRYCGRQFGRSDYASTRTFPTSRGFVDTDDFWTTDELSIGGNAWTTDSTYALEPADGVLDGVPGWPYTRLTSAWAGHPLANYWLSGRTPTLAVTAKWGWAAVPADIVSATLMLAAEEMKLKDTPFGVAGFGDYAIRVRSNPKVAERLDPYRRRVVMAA